MAHLSLYESLAANYKKAIEQGSIKPGSKLPSLRSLTRQHGVSLTTALKMCRHLEETGYVQSRPRSGYVVCLPAPVHKAAPLKQARGAADTAQFVDIHKAVSAFIAGRVFLPHRFDLSQASAAADLYPSVALRTHATRLLRQQPKLLSEAPPLQGNVELRAGLAQRALASKTILAPQDILVTSGGTEALNLALRAIAEPGDVIAVESPAFYGLLQLLEMQRLKALEIPTLPHSGLSVEALELALEMGTATIKAVVVVPILQNPLGCVMPEHKKHKLLALCLKHDITIIEDDSYRDFLDPEPLCPSIKSLDTDGQVIYCASLHKMLAPGIRLGWMSAGKWQSRVEMLKYAQSHNTDGLSQAIAGKFLLSRDYDRHLLRFRSLLKHRLDATAQAIRQYFPAGTHINHPAGGTQLWVTLPAGYSSRIIYEEAQKRGILIAPGFLFSNNGKFDNCLRINGSWPEDHERHAVIAELATVIQRSLSLTSLPSMPA